MHVAGIPSTPVDLLLLGALCCLGRGWTFDDLEESTGIDEETIFFHKFIFLGSTVLFDYDLVSEPRNSEEIKGEMREFQ